MGKGVEAVKTIREVLDVLNEEIDCLKRSHRERDGKIRVPEALHSIACLQRAKQIVKASKRCGCAPRNGKR